MAPNRNVLAAIAACSIVGASLVGTASASEEAARHVQAGRPGCGDARRGLLFYVDAVNRWRDRLDRRPLALAPRGRGCRSVRIRATAWRERSRLHRVEFYRWYRRTYEKWRCIHEHEGAWNSNTGNGYYGGLQMDISFQRAHGWDFLARWGTANRWPVWAQLVTAERAYRTRGFGPWPTARYC